ncbi:MAG: sigma 54-interacting transcriptional regulator [Deltaproteobacteria bacterium]|nr:sigma 54-interacting transcriptional regulator [Deltaproteobacteria bacterium]
MARPTIELIDQNNQLIFADTLDGRTISLGRDREGNDILVPCASASRLHGRIVGNEKQGYYYEDCSSNGSTFGQQVIKAQKVRLTHGSVIGIGTYRLVYTHSTSNNADLVRVQKTVATAITLNQTAGFELSFKAKNQKSGIAKTIHVKKEYFTIGSDSDSHAVLDQFYPQIVIKIINNRAFIEAKGQGVRINGWEMEAYPVQLDHQDCIAANDWILTTDLVCGADIKGHPYKIITQNKKMKGLVSKISTYSSFDEPVMILGETGTGKELFANAIHQASGRKDKPFVVINTATIEKTLATSILFGHDKNSFTGSGSGKSGLVVSADGGTLFLDEIAELTPEIQAMLLRTVQYGEVRPVGSNLVKHVNVRLISATNKQINRVLCRDNSGFRDDLFYRLAVKVIELPPLRSRVEDICCLMDHFMQLARAKYTFLPKDLCYAEKAYQEAKNYSWPGNVRELSNACMSAIMDTNQKQVTGIITPAIKAFLNQSTTIPEHLHRFYEKTKAKHDIDVVCSELGISRATYYRYRREVGEE